MGAAIDRSVASLFAPAFSLETPAVRGEPVLDWLADSHATPSRFAAALDDWAHRLGVPAGKTDPAIGTDLYHDLVARHLGRGQLALRVYVRSTLSGAGRWDELSFDELHARCTYRASWWAAHGIGPGASLAIVLPFGAELAVSWLAGLRLGAAVSWLPPDGPDFVVRRLTALAPSHLATEPFFAQQLPAFAKLVIPPDALAQLPESYSHTYAPGEACLRVFSPLHTPHDAAVAVAADSVYFGALRDSLACLALRPGDRLAAPGFHALQYQPLLLFAAWVIGAAYIDITEQDAIRDPTLLDATPLRCLGLTPRVRDAYLRARRGHRPPWQHVVRNPEEPCDWEAWRDLIDGCGLGDAAFSSLIADAASGGALLASARRPGARYLAALQHVMPAPGRPWQLIDFTRSGQPSAADAGVYARVAGKKPRPIAPHYVVIARRGTEYLYGGTIEPRRSGRLYPVEDVLAAAARAPFLDGAAVVPVVSGGAASEVRFVLVGFTGDEPGPAFDAALQSRCAELRRLIAAGVGADLVPDRIEVFPLYARRAKGAVDVAWCEAQYVGGVLFRKTQTAVVRRLGALRRSLRATPAKAATWR